MLQSAFGEKSLSAVWRSSYKAPAKLLIATPKGFVEVSSETGSRQGCVVGGLGFSASLRDPLVKAEQGSRH
jgi:hypothetical protein